MTSGTVKVKLLVQLLRAPFFLTAANNCEIAAMHVNTEKNTVADSLSRGRIEKFKSLVPNAQPYKTVPTLLYI